MKAIFYGVMLMLWFFGATAYAQQVLPGGDELMSRLKDYNKQHPTEKAYVQLDKPYSATGDTLYFKAYVTLGERHQPSQLSGVLHVELINTAGKIDQSIKLKLTNGI